VLQDCFLTLYRYTRKLLKATFLPALDSGICLEAHGQNILVRIDKSTCEVVGFVVRDLGGVKCYSPKLRQKGYVLTSALPGSFVVTDSEEEGWGIVQHTVIQNHIQHLIRRLHVEPARAWSAVREQIQELLAVRQDHDDSARFERFLFAPKVRNKAFLGMKLRGLYRDVSVLLTCLYGQVLTTAQYEYTLVPNVLMTK
jgi:siderophore synthetase component